MPGRYFSFPAKINWTDLGKKTLLILLLPVFFVLKGSNENFDLIPFDVFGMLLVRYIIISLSVFGISLFFFRKVSKATLFSLCLLCIFFFFGAFHDLLKKIFGPGIITSYSFLLPFIFIISCVLFFILFRSKKNLKSVLIYFTYLLILLNVLETGTFVYKTFNEKSYNDLSLKPLEIKSGKDSCLTVTKPDIFFVVLDGYTSSQCLKEEFNYTNEHIDSLLRSNHFFTSAFSKSNYNVTPFSLASTFNMDYLKPGLENKYNSSKVFLQAVKTLKNTYLVDFFKKKGYSIKNFSVFNLMDAPAQTRPLFDNNRISGEISDQTMYSRIMKDIGWNFAIRNSFTGAFKIPGDYKRTKEYYIFRNQYNWDHLLDEIRTDSDKPRFVYAHIMLPHEPFYFNNDGSLVSDTVIILHKYDTKTAYFNQLLYTNRLLADFIPLVTKAGKRERIIIIEGDHGFRDYSVGISQEKNFMNLNTYYFSDHNYSALYDSISPVNSFRVILNKYFCQSFPMVRDSSIYLHE